MYAANYGYDAVVALLLKLGSDMVREWGLQALCRCVIGLYSLLPSHCCCGWVGVPETAWW